MTSCKKEYDTDVSQAMPRYSVKVRQGSMETVKREISSFERHNFGVRQTSSFPHKLFEREKIKCIKLRYLIQLLYYCSIAQNIMLENLLVDD